MIPATDPYIQVQNKNAVYRFLPMRRHTAEEVLGIRKTCGMTQAAFARMMGVSRKTIESWEQGVNTPGSAAARLLDLIEYDHGFASMFEGKPLTEYDYDTGKAKSVRTKTGLPRELFSLAIGVTETTAARWEQGRSRPNGPASRPLDLVG